MKILLYGNGSSGNHGCEAIVRGTVKTLNDINNTFIVASENKKDDEKYGLESVVNLVNSKAPIKKDWKFFKAYLKLKFMKSYVDMDTLPYLTQMDENIPLVDVALSIGGDNYCYGATEFYAKLNEYYHKKGMKTILWGCSIEPDVVSKKEVMKDLRTYNYIVARESITYEAIRKVTSHVTLLPDPAFLMGKKVCKTNELFEKRDIVGINISPMIISNEKKQNMAYLNYQKLIEYILKETNYGVALIPHVVWKDNDDREVLKKLYMEFCELYKDRIILVEDHGAEELKYIISKCRFFVGARTHATIAAYSSQVPTLVVGYSVKARGIAKDIFHQEEKYVIPVQKLSKENDLSNGFKWIISNENKIKKYLNQYMEETKEKFDHIKDKINRALNDEDQN